MRYVYIKSWAQVPSVILLLYLNCNFVIFVSCAAPLEGDVPVRDKESWVIPSIGMQLKRIPNGTFFMGSPFSDYSSSVTISNDYWMGSYEVTQEQYKMVFPKHTYKNYKPNIPVSGISWLDAMEFCIRLNEIEDKSKRIPDGYVYRLPTMAEWEYACRARSKSLYSFGDNAERLKLYAWYELNSKGSLHDVGRLAPNAFGLYDMYGNVEELCIDTYGLSDSDSKIDPFIGTIDEQNKATRGGNYTSIEENCYSGVSWSTCGLEHIQPWVGFRIVLAKKFQQHKAIVKLIRNTNGVDNDADNRAIGGHTD